MWSVRLASPNLRRWLLVALALVLPLKGAVAAIVPIIGTPLAAVASLDADATAAEFAPDAAPGADAAVHEAAADAATPPCHGHAAGADASPADSAPCCDSLHDHSCPHLAMATLATAIHAPELPAAAPQRASAPAAHDASVALEVPSPPPNAVD